MPSYGGDYLSKPEAHAYARLLLSLYPVTEVHVEINEQARRHYSVRVHWLKKLVGPYARYLDSPTSVAVAVQEIMEDSV